MRHRDFCYWLQGAFELCDPAKLNTVQVVRIKQHLSMVDESQKDVKQESPHAPFCRMLRTILGDSPVIEESELSVIKKMLNGEFIHIDANTEGDQDALDTIHNTGRPPRPPGARC